MPRKCNSRYLARFAETDADVQAAQTLRYRCFRGGDGMDVDLFDAMCRHVLIEDQTTGEVAGCFRLMFFRDGSQINTSYAAQYYELSALKSYKAPMVELGRFCIAPEVEDGADVLRVAWAMLTQCVDDSKTGMLFGCSSFKGTDEAAYFDTFSMLKDNHLAPKRWLPRVKAPKVFRYGEGKRRTTDRKRGLRMMPPLLRSYLTMGGWVSDHAVVDHDLNTLHVFTGLEIASVPPARARLLRAVVG
ncbi:GNAT family N-acetyltransferase [Aliiroseovarius lamellibrachiae]|uniref:GNAT family N-acetyltransferase n=1 Tax=Aliiroseovarius lamellibrachiae TaxID=1924933 RepID=UPI001BE07CC4|nr:GNAT family N-acetyltransferase [Aliiroseovarius lamellibrachiae]MBT2131256.1 GNAT family N-acetyltransferase [Aliiroseovarius lamellibrachiae]